VADYKISQLTALTDPEPDDLVAAVDVNDTTTPPAGAGGSNKKMAVATLDARYRPNIPVTGDTTGSTDGPAVASALSTYGYFVLYPGAQYYSAAPLDMPSNGFADGNAATISPGSAWSSSGTVGLLQLTGSINTTVRDLNLLDTWTVTGLNGLYWNSANSVPNNHIRRVVARGFKGSGIVLVSSADSASAHATDCEAYGNLGDGFQLSSDQLVSNCEAGFNYGHGFHFLEYASNVYASNCLSWYSGVNPQTGIWPGSGTSCGYFVDQAGQFVRISNCWAQQNGLHGYAVGATSGGDGYSYQVSVTDGGADTNASYGGTGYGVFISGAFSGKFESIGGDNNGGLSPGSQEYGIYALGTCTGTKFGGNTINGTSGPADLSGASGYTQATYS
jgi:hypothetical protein